jgi:alpha-D-ribose 1-methylphosphonate 5-triphosphate diphosphatase PhnM
MTTRSVGEEQPQVQILLADVVVAARDQQRVACGVSRIFRAADHLGEERVGDIGHDHGKGLGSPLGEAAREQIGLVAERGDRRLHARLEAGADERAVVQHRRHGGQRHARALRDVVNIRHRSPGPAF